MPQLRRSCTTVSTLYCSRGIIASRYFCAQCGSTTWRQDTSPAAINSRGWASPPRIHRHRSQLRHSQPLVVTKRSIQSLFNIKSEHVFLVFGFPTAFSLFFVLFCTVFLCLTVCNVTIMYQYTTSFLVIHFLCFPSRCFHTLLFLRMYFVEMLFEDTEVCIPW